MVFTVSDLVGDVVGVDGVCHFWFINSVGVTVCVTFMCLWVVVFICFDLLICCCASNGCLLVWIAVVFACCIDCWGLYFVCLLGVLVCWI